MSKINAVRLINLNYNNNAIRVSDETFQMGGQSTLLSLRNGGGKSVLVQMMTAPFVHKQYRRTKDRPFESYFTTAKPTFLLVEWELDEQAGYCLTGMMVRKSQASEEQSSEPLEIINFISEYESRCETDLYHLPVVEKTKKEIVLKSFHACRQLFETYKKDPEKKFFFYDMNNSAQSRQYFNKLSEYRIYYKEWETIIRKVNLKESGLSELFSDCKNEKELIEKWFLETIQDKLNQEKDRVKEFQSIVDKYIRTYKDNKSKIERRDTILKLKEDMLEVEEKAKTYQDAENKVKDSENRIACFLQELNKLEKSAQDAQQALEIKSGECRAQMSRILYEKLSMELHNLSDELQFHSSNRDMIQLEKDALDIECEKIEMIVHQYECAKQQEVIDEQRQEYENLTQRIAVSKKDEQELEPERKQIGGFLNAYYQKNLETVTEKIGQTEVAYQQTQEKERVQREKELESQKRLDECREKIAEQNAEIKGFTQKEDAFNRMYQEAFARNILGEYEPGMLEIKKEQYEKEQTEYARNCKEHIRQQAESEERQKALERKTEDLQKKKQNKKLQLGLLVEKGNKFDAQIKERQTILRYLDVEETMLWNTAALLEAADRKIADIDRTRLNLNQEKTALQKEWKKLTSGEVLELPQEFKELLEELELHPVYGMNWLQKNGNSVEKNTELVRRQPFLPYSLILPSAEIKTLEAHGTEIYTSFPIPILPREAMEASLVEEESSLLHLSGISFYLWFNEKLLDEEALRVLIAQKEAQLNKKQEQIDRKNQEYQEYTEKRSVLKQQTITKESVEQNRKEQQEAEEEIHCMEETIDRCKEELLQEKQTFQNLLDTIQKEKLQMERCRQRENAFAQFCADYACYQKQRQEVEQSKKDKERFEEQKKLAVSLQQQYAQKRFSLENEKQKYEAQKKAYKEKQIRYTNYEPDALFETALSPNELEARYEAITTKMSSELQLLEEQQQRAAKLLLKEQTELQKLQKKYRIEETAWAGLIYDEKEQQHQEILLEDKRKKAKEKERLWNEEDKQIAVLNSQIDGKTKDMEQQCGYTEPLSKKEIHTVDFEAEMNQLNYQLAELAKENKAVEKRLHSFRENLTALSEYQDFSIQKEVEWEENPAQMSEKRLREFSGILRRDFRQYTEEQKRSKDRLEAHLNRLTRKEEYQEDYYQKPLEAMLAVTYAASLVLAQLDTTMQSYDSQMEKLAVDIAMVEKEKNKIVELLEDYIKEVHRNMGKIDSNSTITIRERPIKMLRLQLPDWEENEGLYHQRLEDFMDELTRNGIEIYEKNENATDYLSSRITTKYLYNTVVGIGNIQIKLYKIEEQREYPITWAEVARNSGGEGFLSAFVILSSLLYYMRRDDTDIFADRNEGKVLVMDNPFAQTNAAHLLKPLMDMAKKTNTQLICLSGLGGDSIYSRFDNIYVLNLVSASLRDGTQYLRGEHRRKAQEEVMVSSQIEVYEQQSLLF
ncbi:MAG: hypothetical protein ACI4HI_14765 [Lachnospiraceae bacterium]